MGCHSNVAVLDIDLIHSTKCYEKLKISYMGNVTHITSYFCLLSQKISQYGDKRHFCHLDRFRWIACNTEPWIHFVRTTQTALNRVRSEALRRRRMLGRAADIVILVWLLVIRHSYLGFAISEPWDKLQNLYNHLRDGEVDQMTLQEILVVLKSLKENP